jgi:hypothetical protein
MSSNQNKNNVRHVTPVAALEGRLRHCRFSEQYVKVIRALVATGEQDAVRVLASLLDSTGPIAEESIAGLVQLAEAGLEVLPAMSRCVDTEDYELMRHAHRVLAALGRETSAQWLAADDDERIEIYLESKGITREDAQFLVTPHLANDGTDEEGAA